MARLYPDEYTLVEPLWESPEQPIQGLRQVYCKDREFSDGLFDFQVFDPMLWNASSSGQWGLTVSGTAAAVDQSSYGKDSTDSAFGVVELTTGSTNNGRAAIRLYGSNDAIQLGTHHTRIEWRMALSDLDDGVDKFVVRFGFHDALDTASVNETDGVSLSYYRDADGDFWTLYCRSSTGNGKLVSTVAPVADEFHHFMLEVYPNKNGGYTATFFYDGESKVSISNTAQIPDNTGQLTGIGAKIQKLLGTNARSLYIDSFRLTALSVRT